MNEAEETGSTQTMHGFTAHAENMKPQPKFHGEPIQTFQKGWCDYICCLREISLVASWKMDWSTARMDTVHQIDCNYINPVSRVSDLVNDDRRTHGGKKFLKKPESN